MLFIYYKHYLPFLPVFFSAGGGLNMVLCDVRQRWIRIYEWMGMYWRAFSGREWGHNADPKACYHLNFE